MSQRLTLAVRSGDFVLPQAGRIAVFNPDAQADLSALPRAQCVVIQPQRPDHDFWSDQGFACQAEAAPEGVGGDAAFAAAVVFIPRAKPLARRLVAQAAAATDGPVLVDGVKTDGIDSLLKELKARTSPSGAISKAHGKAFVIAGHHQGGGADLADWCPPARSQVEGFVTAPGVFSADGIDPASALLAQALPRKLGRKLADLGAGWGYLSAQILTREGVELLHAVEADHTALACARENLADPRVQFHWADARSWGSKASVDTVVMNPPFHSGRSAEPALGQAFIANAARLLTGSGQLWMVANRHLPYEDTLARHFQNVSEIGGDGRFKILQAHRPRTPGQGTRG